jgi:ubiquinone/menaquinone biosynthesis C-methylase UbiE
MGKKLRGETKMEKFDENDKKAVKLQYSDSTNFNARVRLSKQFSTNKYGWNRWIFDQIQFPANAMTLELGCGPAYLWRANSYRVPQDARIILSDFSEGMMKEAKMYLETEHGNYDFEIINAEEIPFDKGSFDMVIANLMLYHVPDRNKALYEISRVLKNDGVLYTTTIGINSMKELAKLFSDCFSIEGFNIKSAAEEFGLENGMAQLQKYFKEVKLLRYEDALEVMESKPLVDYAFSTQRMHSMDKSQKSIMMKIFGEYLDRIIKAEGVIRITKDTGMFIAKQY